MAKAKPRKKAVAKVCLICSKGSAKKNSNCCSKSMTSKEKGSWNV